MTRLRVAAVAISALVTTLLPAVPTAAEISHGQCVSWSYATSVTDALCFPVAHRQVVVIEGDGPMWGLRSAAKAIAQQVPGLQLYAGASAQCSRHADAYCIRVSVVPLGADRAAEFRINGGAYVTGATGGTIRLSTSFAGAPYWERKIIVAHEFMHALGFTHHAGPGLAGDAMYDWATYAPRAGEPSTDELAALRRWYVAAPDGGRAA